MSVSQSYIQSLYRMLLLLLPLLLLLIPLQHT